MVFVYCYFQLALASFYESDGAEFEQAVELPAAVEDDVDVVPQQLSALQGLLAQGNREPSAPQKTKAESTRKPVPRLVEHFPSNTPTETGVYECLSYTLITDLSF